MYADIHAGIDTPALQLLQGLGNKKTPNIHTLIPSLLTKHGSLEISLVLLSFLSRHSASSTPEKLLPELLPTYIRLCSLIVQKYLQLKNQPAQGTQDRIEDDKIVLQCCQKWLVGCIDYFFKNLVKVEDREVREIVFVAVCDIMGAILEIERGGALDKTLTHNLLTTTFLPYILQNYSYSQLHSQFTTSLHSSHFSNPIKKIQIPQKYSLNPQYKLIPNAQAYCFVITKLLGNTSVSAVLSDQEMIKLLVPAIGEILCRPYQIKLEGIAGLLGLVDRVGQVSVRTGWEWGYPIQLLLFYFWQYQKQQYPQLRKHISFTTQQTHLQSLLTLQNLQPLCLPKQKQKYILSQIKKQSLYKDRQIWLILKKIEWGQLKPKRQLYIIELIEKLREEQVHQKDIRDLCKKWLGVTQGEDVRGKLGEIVGGV